MTDIIQLDNQDVLSKLRSVGFPVQDIYGFSKGGNGDHLTIEPYPAKAWRTNGYIVLYDKTARYIPVPDKYVHFNSTNKPVAWYSGRNEPTKVNFASGESLQLPAFARFHVDSTGQYFVIGTGASTTRIGRVDNPKTTFLVSDALRGIQVFYAGDAVYIAGWDGRAKGPPGYGGLIKVKVHGNGVEVLQTWHFPGMDPISDIDAEGKRVIMEKRTDFFPHYYVVDLTTGTKKNIGRARKRAFFMPGWHFEESRK